MIIKITYTIVCIVICVVLCYGNHCRSNGVGFDSQKGKKMSGVVKTRKKLENDFFLSYDVEKGKTKFNSKKNNKKKAKADTKQSDEIEVLDSPRKSDVNNDDDVKLIASEYFDNIIEDAPALVSKLITHRTDDYYNADKLFKSGQNNIVYETGTVRKPDEEGHSIKPYEGKNRLVLEMLQKYNNPW